MNFKDKNILNWILLIFWMGVIFYFSNQLDLKSGFESRLDFILRKAAHIAEYAILTYLAWQAIGDGVKSKKYLIYAVIFSILYAIGDEYHQTFVRSRIGSPIDVLVDSVGITLAGLIIWKRK
ncbi:MAG: VanZ family protein [bacterium]|nr:VanZ family protein [bacterium]